MSYIDYYSYYCRYCSPCSTAIMVTSHYFNSRSKHHHYHHISYYHTTIPTHKTVASPEVKFVLDSESLNPTDVQAYQLFEANSLVEEFMLLANVTVGKKILRHYPTLSILRRHPAPNRTMFDSLIGKARCRGFTIEIEDSKRLADSLDAAVIEGDDYFNKLLRILSTRCMSPAQYFCSGEYKPTGECFNL